MNVPRVTPPYRKYNRPYLTLGGLNDNSGQYAFIKCLVPVITGTEKFKAFNKTTAQAWATLLLPPGTRPLCKTALSPMPATMFLWEKQMAWSRYTSSTERFSKWCAGRYSHSWFCRQSRVWPAYDESRKITIHASGDGLWHPLMFPCPATLYSINIVPDCVSKRQCHGQHQSPLPRLHHYLYLIQWQHTIASNTTGVLRVYHPISPIPLLPQSINPATVSQASTSFVIPGAITHHRHQYQLWQ